MRVLVIGALLSSGFSSSVALCQNATPSTLAAVGGTGAGAAAQQAHGPPTTQPSANGLTQREELTGDWWGVRARWKDKGFVLDTSLTQFYQGVASGGTETGSE